MRNHRWRREQRNGVNRYDLRPVKSMLIPSIDCGDSQATAAPQASTKRIDRDGRANIRGDHGLERIRDARHRFRLLREKIRRLLQE